MQYIPMTDSSSLPLFPGENIIRTIQVDAMFYFYCGKTGMTLFTVCLLQYRGVLLSWSGPLLVTVTPLIDLIG